MPVEIRTPAFAESVHEATVGRWLKRLGERVEVGEPVVELETDKVNLQATAEAAGIVASVNRPEGTVVHEGDVLGTIEVGAAAAAGPPPPQPDRPAEREGPASDGVQELRVSPLAQRVAEDLGVELREVRHAEPRHRITREDVEAHVREQPGSPAPRATAPAAAGPAEPAIPAAPATPEAPARTPESTPPAPAAVARRPLHAAAAPASEEPPATQTLGPRERRERLSRRRLTIARNLVRAQQTAAMLSTFNEVDMSAMMALRARRRDAFKERFGVSLGYMSFFTRAVVGALRAFPLLNSELRDEELIIKEHYDIGIAIGDSEGLVVPVLRAADRLTFAQIEQQIADLALRARERRLTMADLEGGTFTITNGGVFGSLLSTPILNPPQVGILGMHRIQERPVAVEGAVVIRPMMYLALTYDHRVVDGRDAVQFLVRVKELAEDPERLLLEG